MSILDLHADEMETAALNTRRDPYVAPRRSAWGAILTAAPRGAFRAAAEVGASLADIGGAVAAFRDTPSSEMERGGLPASAFSSDLGDSVRSYWDSLKPDPLTVTKTEQVLYGFARGAAKIIPATIAAGPVGAIAAGGEEAMTVSDELRQQGVPDGTRQLAGIVQGTGLASAALPLVWRTLGETAALYLAGGPGGFVAQQALTRKILENAGQDKIAGQYDPFDPVGLTVAAALPGFFTYRALKGQSAARAADAKATAAKAESDFMAAPVPSAKTATAQAAEAYTRESVDAAMVQNVIDTSDATMHELTRANAGATELARVVESAGGDVRAGYLREAARLRGADAATTDIARHNAIMATMLEARAATAQEPAPPRAPTQTAVTEAAPGTPAIPTTKAPDVPPDTPIRLDDSGNRVTFAADLAEVQRLAAEGTDDTLGTLDADLFRVAVECALSGG